MIPAELSDRAFMFNIHLMKAIAFTIAVEGDDFRYTDVTAEAERVGGMRREDQVGRRPQDCFPSSLATSLVGHYRRCVTTIQPVVYDTEYVLPNGYFCWRTTLVPVQFGPGNAPTSLFGLCIDATADRIAERAKLAFQEKLSLAIGALDGGFWVHDVTTGCFETSRPLAELLAGPGHATLNLAEYINFIHADDLKGDLLTSCVDRTAVEYRVITYEGRTRWLQSKLRIVHGEHGAAAQIVGLVLDVTEQKNVMRTLQSEAATDDLTKLKNRRAFDRIAAQAWRDACSEETALGLILVDLDGFKPINDRYGHRAGDEVLRKVARRIARQVRPSDTLARIGGDEFAILVRDDPAAMIEVTIGRLARSLQKALRIDDRIIQVGASIGKALRCGDDVSFATLLERADRALYTSKHERRLLTARTDTTAAAVAPHATARRGLSPVS